MTNAQRSALITEIAQYPGQIVNSKFIHKHVDGGHMLFGEFGDVFIVSDPDKSIDGEIYWVGTSGKLLSELPDTPPIAGKPRDVLDQIIKDQYANMYKDTEYAEVRREAAEFRNSADEQQKLVNMINEL